MSKKLSVITLMFLIVGLIILSLYEVFHVFGTAQRYEYELPNDDIDIIFSLDKSEIISIKSKDILSIDGWAFIRDENAEMQKIYIALVSDKNKYIFDVEKEIRNDVPAVFSDFEKKLENSGFRTKIQMNDIKKDIYKLGVFIKNDKKTEFTLTDLNISNIGDNVEISQRKNELRSTKIESISDSKVMTNLEQIEFVDNTYKIEGWAFIKDKVMTDDTEISVVLKSKNETLVFDTNRKLREDVTAYFGGGLNLDKSGFISNIDRNMLNDKEYKIGICVSSFKTGGIYWSKESIGE